MRRERQRVMQLLGVVGRPIVCRLVTRFERRLRRELAAARRTVVSLAADLACAQRLAEAHAREAARLRGCLR